jgi:hypothetical protein
MSERSGERLRVDGVPELWFQPPDSGRKSAQNVSTRWLYRPSVFVECTLNFRSLRAGMSHSEDHEYTSWLPEGDAAIDWDLPVVQLECGALLTAQPQDVQSDFYPGNFPATRRQFSEYQAELVDKLVRNSRLRLFHSAEFELFSAPDETLQDFLPRVAEAALRLVEPDLMQLRRKFELQIEQIREARTRKGFRTEGLSVEKILLGNLQLFESENRMTSVFSTLAGTVFGTTEQRHHPEHASFDEPELSDDLERIEQEARDALRALYDKYTVSANDHDIFEIGLQPDNIKIVRCALLWVPVEGPA